MVCQVCVCCTPMAENAATTIRLTKTDRLNARIVSKFYLTTTSGAIRLALAETARRLLAERGPA